MDEDLQFEEHMKYVEIVTIRAIVRERMSKVIGLDWDNAQLLLDAIEERDSQIRNLENTLVEERARGLADPVEEEE